MLQQAETMRNRLIGLVGRQGVGKSAALQAIYVSQIMAQEDERRRAAESKSKLNGSNLFEEDYAVLFKWRREEELFKSLFDETHELSASFRLKYRNIVWEQVRKDERITDREKYEQHGPGTLDLKWAEARLGKSVIGALRREAWLETLVHCKFILVDMPDYSKTDRRLLAKDLEGIYWLWNMVAHNNIEANIVVAIQKEMFRDHFFFDKMDKVDLEPLRREQMVEAYRKRFNAIEPFTEEALLTLAGMSRGIFRRFLKYITLALRQWEASGKRAIDTVLVEQAVPLARLAEDMELELAELFPKHSDLRLLAVRLLMLLEESGGRKQSELADSLEVEPYVLSRLLTKLEAARYITRRREGNDKIVSLYNAQNQAPEILG